MEPNIYRLQHLHNDTECRAVVRRETIRDLWRRYGSPQKGSRKRRILEVGCGSGATLSSFQESGTVVGIDISSEALHYCRARGIQRLVLSDGSTLPFADQVFEFVFSVDVLEHIDDDLTALNEIYRILEPGGLFVGVVPAFSSLWSSRDVRLGHKRRYAREELRDKVRKAGFTITKLAYLDALGFPAIYLWFRLKRIGREIADIKMDVLSLSKPLNLLLLMVMRLETRILTKVSVPFGVALLCVAKRP